MAHPDASIVISLGKSARGLGITPRDHPVHKDYPPNHCPKPATGPRFAEGPPGSKPCPGRRIQAPPEADLAVAPVRRVPTPASLAVHAGRYPPTRTSGAFAACQRSGKRPCACLPRPAASTLARQLLPPRNARAASSAARITPAGPRRSSSDYAPANRRRSRATPPLFADRWCVRRSGCTPGMATLSAAGAALLLRRSVSRRPGQVHTANSSPFRPAKRNREAAGSWRLRRCGRRRGSGSPRPPELASRRTPAVCDCSPLRGRRRCPRGLGCAGGLP